MQNTIDKDKLQERISNALGDGTYTRLEWLMNAEGLYVTADDQIWHEIEEAIVQVIADRIEEE